MLIKHDHPMPLKPQLSPHKHREIQYGAKFQQAMDEDTSPPLNTYGIKRVQQFFGSLMYYARAIDNKLLVAFNAIEMQQSAATEQTEQAISELLDYVATYPNDDTIYCSSGMALAASTDAGFNNESKGRSRAGAHIFISEDDPEPRWNGPILTIAQIIKFVMTSTAEAKLGALYLTAK
jgi:hypothetical protein